MLVLFTGFLVEHSLPIAVSDHAGPLFRRMFPDSEIAKQYSCARTKTTNIVGCLANNDMEKLAGRMKNEKYSIATDGSTDLGSIKLYPLVVKTFDNLKGDVVCDLLCIKECSERSTSENIINILNNELKAWDIPWATHCVARELKATLWWRLSYFRNPCTSNSAP